jgi:hypothetical protein
MVPNSAAVCRVEFLDGCVVPETAGEIAEPDELLAVTVTQ